MTQTLKVKQERNEIQVTISLEGELVGISARQFQEELEQLINQGVKHFIIDFSRVTSIDSIGAMAFNCLNENIASYYRELLPKSGKYLFYSKKAKIDNLIGCVLNETINLQFIAAESI